MALSILKIRGGGGDRTHQYALPLTCWLSSCYMNAALQCLSHSYSLTVSRNGFQISPIDSLRKLHSVICNSVVLLPACFWCQQTQQRQHPSGRGGGGASHRPFSFFYSLSPFPTPFTRKWPLLFTSSTLPTSTRFLSLWYLFVFCLVLTLFAHICYCLFLFISLLCRASDYSVRD